MTPDDPTPAPADPARLAHIVNDLDARAEADDWARDELVKGRTPEEITTDLVGNGWSEGDAEEIVEAQRQATRRLRGVLTRDDVAAASAASYRKSWRLSWFSISPIWSSAWRLILSLSYLSRVTPPGDAAARLRESTRLRRARIAAVLLAVALVLSIRSLHRILRPVFHQTPLSPTTLPGAE